ncbi:unnamed protein product, partial [marine sediment metagenome]
GLVAVVQDGLCYKVAERVRLQRVKLPTLVAVLVGVPGIT